MAKWREGYVFDSQYVSNSFFDECTPTHLNLVALLNGIQPPPTDQFTYIELGAGHGYMACIMAAVYPEGTFHVVDYNPDHIAAGLEVAHKAALKNITFHCLSFSELLKKPDLLPEADYIVAHGVYSWVNEVNRGAIQQIVGKKLKNNGLFYVSYNALPGASGNAALQHLIYQHALRHPKSSTEQASEGLSFVKNLEDTGIALYKMFPMLSNRIANLEKQSPTYLAHEFMNQEWRAFYFAEIFDHFTKVGLSYLNITDFAYNDPLTQGFPVSTPDHIKPLFKDIVMRETFRNYSYMLPFRKDVFVKNPQVLELEVQIEKLKDVCVCAVKHKDEFVLESHSLMGWDYFNVEIFTKWRKRLEDGVVSIRALSEDAPELSFLDVIRIVLLQLSKNGEGKNATLIPARATPADPVASQRLNRLIIKDKPFNKRMPGLAAPTTGTCQVVSQHTLLAFMIHTARETEGLPPLAPHELATALEEKFKERKEMLEFNGEVFKDTIALKGELARFSHRFYERVLPKIQHSGIVL
jgi:hypothetical protein